MLIAIMGEVYGVPFTFNDFITSPDKGPQFYGIDNSRGFVPGRFDKYPASDELLDLSPEEIKTVTLMLDDYRNSTTRTKVGVLHGKYFDCDCQPTDYRQKVLEKADLASNQDAELLRRHRRNFCMNMRRHPKRTVLCEESRFPRLLKFKDGTEGDCICLDEDDIKAFESSTMTIHRYPGCEDFSMFCQLDPVAPDEE